MTAGRPAVSVVMPVHNAGGDLGEALASVLGQTFADFELIALDDHSTDDSAARLRRAAEEDDRVRCIPSPGQGFVAAVNAGLAASRGDWVARMDADDRSHPERIARQLAHLASHPDIDVLGTSVCVIDAAGNPAGTIRYPLEHPLIVLSLRAATAFAHGTVVVRRAALAAAGGYRADRFPVEDYDLWCRLALAGARLANLDEALYDYRLSAGGVSRTDTARQRAMAAEVGDEYGRLLRSVPSVGDAWRAAATIARQAADGAIDVRAGARAARSTRESIVPWARSRRWPAAAASLAASFRAEAAYRRLTTGRRDRR
jgi:glycosyltransferase involved in cell wall biosynthesis